MAQRSKKSPEQYSETERDEDVKALHGMGWPRSSSAR